MSPRPDGTSSPARPLLAARRTASPQPTPTSRSAQPRGDDACTDVEAPSVTTPDRFSGNQLRINALRDYVDGHAEELAADRASDARAFAAADELGRFDDAENADSHSKFSY